MFQDAYIKLDKDATKTLVEALRPHFDGGGFDPESTVVMARELPFYKNSRFFDIADHRTMPPLRRFVIEAGGLMTALDFTNRPIYALNAKLPVRLSADSVIDYLKFFFSFVRGQHGRFLIVESVDDIPWREDPPPAARKAVGKMISPVTLSSSQQDAYSLQAHMMYKDSLFEVAVDVRPDGHVDIRDKALLIEDIPVLDDTLGQ